jgi:hypothetical protein
MLSGLVVLTPVVVFILPCLALVLLARTIRHAIEPQFSSWPQLLAFDPTFGWGPKPNLNAHHLVDDVFHLTTDADGWRGHTPLADAELVVYGDSFAWGYGISDKHYFAHNMTPLRVKAIGTMGYNMVQSLLWMQHTSSCLHGKLVVWFIYYGNDLYENLVPNMRHYRMPFVREIGEPQAWEIVKNHVDPSPWPLTIGRSNVGMKYYEKLAELCAPTFLARRAYAACAFLIQQGRDICQGSGARLIVIGIPDVTQFSAQGVKQLQQLVPEGLCVDPDYPDMQLRQICQVAEVPFVTLKDHLRLEDHKIHDVHWNEKGHKRVAEVLKRLYQEYASSRTPSTGLV